MKTRRYALAGIVSMAVAGTCLQAETTKSDDIDHAAPTAASTKTYNMRPEIFAWILANNPTLKNDFLVTAPPATPLKLPNGTTTEIYKLKQFLDFNFKIRHSAKGKKGAAIVSAVNERYRKLLATPEFYAWVQKKAPFKKDKPNPWDANKTYSFFRTCHRRIGVSQVDTLKAPVGGSGGIGVKRWNGLQEMDIFAHETGHALGFDHTGGFTYGMDGAMKKMDKRKLANYATIDPNQMQLPVK